MKKIQSAVIVLTLVGIILVSGCVKNESLPKEEFCGISTEFPCKSDEDCRIGGCSSHICMGKAEEDILTTCEWKDCYRSESMECVCFNGKCQWN